MNSCRLNRRSYIKLGKKKTNPVELFLGTIVFLGYILVFGPKRSDPTRIGFFVSFWPHRFQFAGDGPTLWLTG